VQPVVGSQAVVDSGHLRHLESEMVQVPDEGPTDAFVGIGNEYRRVLSWQVVRAPAAARHSPPIRGRAATFDGPHS
jgi:hypothetical protein